MELKNKKIILAITGGIAAYKIPELVRLFIKEGAEVKVIMTEVAKEFVSPLVLSVLSKNEVLIGITKDLIWNNHVDLALWGDIMIVAPCTLNTIGKFANGICDNLVCATYFSMRGKVFIFPAMDCDMWEHKSTLRNIDILIKDNIIVTTPEMGFLASGLYGFGRMKESKNIIEYLQEFEL